MSRHFECVYSKEMSSKIQKVTLDEAEKLLFFQYYVCIVNTQISVCSQYTRSTGRTDIQILVYMLVMTLFLWILIQLSVNIFT